MRLPRTSLLLAAAATVMLAACSTPQPLQANDEVSVPASGPHLAATALPQWTGDDDLTVEVLGTGLGNSNSATNSATFAIPNPENVVKVYVQVVTKAGTSGEGTYPDPTEITIRALDAADSELGSASYTGGTVERIGIQSQLGVGDNVGSSGITGYSHEAGFNGQVASVSVDLTFPPPSSDDPTPPLSPRALIVSVFRDLDDGSTSSGLLPNVYVFGNDGYPNGEQTILLPAGFAGGDVTVTFAVSDVEQYSRSSGFTENDPRIFYFSASAGGVSAEVKQDEPTHGPDLAIVELTLAGVPAGTTEVLAKLYSPSNEVTKPDPEGDSIYWSTVNVTVNTPEEGGSQGCTPGYWRQEHHFDSWTGYTPGQLFADVFDRVITVRTGGRDTDDNPTLKVAVWAVGGDINALARHATAALLNSANSGVDYPYTTDEVITAVQNAIDDGSTDALNAAKDLLANANELGCQLN